MDLYEMLGVEHQAPLAEVIYNCLEIHLYTFYNEIKYFTFVNNILNNQSNVRHIYIK